MFVWDRGLGAGAGKICQAKRWNRHAVRTNRIDETYEYQGRIGRFSVRRTALYVGGAEATGQLGYAYDEGLVASIGYSFCGSTGCTSGKETTAP